LKRNNPDDSHEKVVIVLDVDNHRFGVVVDTVHDTEEIVVKPLGKQLKSIPTYAGATILGDGQIALILDPVVLAREARVDKQLERTSAATNTAALEDRDRVEREQLLIIHVNSTERAAIPLSKVSRLEEFRVSDVERVGSGSVIKYRGGILRLVDVALSLGRGSTPWASGHVVVIGAGEHAVGLQVHSILDVSVDLAAVRPSEGEPGILSYGVVQGRVIALLDVDHLIRPPQRISPFTADEARPL
jgi:two-component system chemotaxis sensor kinase CheA